LPPLELPSSAGREAGSDDTVSPEGIRYDPSVGLLFSFDRPSLSACPFHEGCDGAFHEGAQEQTALGRQQSQAYHACLQTALICLPPPALPSSAGREAGSDDTVFPVGNTV